MVATLIGAAWLGGCGSAGTPTPPAVPLAGASGEMRSPATLAAGGPTLVPVGRDPDGCIMYRLDAPDRLSIQAITYRTPEGRLTFDRAEADCPAARGGRGRPSIPAAEGPRSGQGVVHQMLDPTVVSER